MMLIKKNLMNEQNILFDDWKPRKAIFGDVSRENPFIQFTKEDIEKYRRYESEKNIPSRFKGITTALSRSLYEPLKPNQILYETTYNCYGKYPPNVHTIPYGYYGLNTRFTNKKAYHGNYRNHSFNC
ncbi:unnamed protein product [Lepeophtheirus salmonis]|uniref:(salmon louse) hypothetical protein n=1 Tax=Lepeophtheirus salmonis TaxID=72036 RepID=A0A7R8D633_LEPSM|nr:unnamed protein product [Lepeophtheirus salmonis]CAF3040968.1 unnamed protein product [Lepeophtheirus salmonis]